MQLTVAKLLDLLDESQTDFARRVGVTPQTICRISSGARKPSPQLAVRIAEVTFTRAIPTADGGFIFERRKKGGAA